MRRRRRRGRRRRTADPRRADRADRRPRLLRPRRLRHRLQPRRRRQRQQPTYNTVEYQRSNYGHVGQRDQRLQRRRDRPGQSRSGSIDSGINPALSEFAGRIDPASGDVAGNRGVSDEDWSRHGGQRGRRRGAATTRACTVSRSTRRSSISAPIAPGSCADPSGDGCKFYDVADRRRGRRRAAGGRPRSSTCRSAGRAPATNCSRRCSARSSAGIVVVISAGNDGERWQQSRSIRAEPGEPVLPGQGHHRRLGRGGRPDGTINTDQLSTFSNQAGSGAQLLSRRARAIAIARSTRPAASICGRGPAFRRRPSPARSRCSPKPSQT